MTLNNIDLSSISLTPLLMKISQINQYYVDTYAVLEVYGYAFKNVRLTFGASNRPFIFFSSNTFINCEIYTTDVKDISGLFRKNIFIDCELNVHYYRPAGNLFNSATNVVRKVGKNIVGSPRHKLESTNNMLIDTKIITR